MIGLRDEPSIEAIFAMASGINVQRFTAAAAAALVSSDLVVIIQTRLDETTAN